MNIPSNSSKSVAVPKKTVALLIVLLFILTGCNESIGDNPVVQSLREGNSYVDLSRDELDGYFDEYSALPDDAPTNVDGDVQEESQIMFNTFITRVQNSDTIQYQRMLSFSAAPPEATTAIDKFLQTPILHVSEMGNHFVITDTEEDNRLISISDGAYLLHLTEENSLTSSEGSEEINENPTDAYGEIKLQDHNTKDLLYTLCKDTQLTLLSVDIDDTGESTQIAFNVNEGERISKWYFDEHGNLFLRIFKDQGESVAIRYDFLDLEPLINEDLFTLEGAKTLPSLKRDEDSGNVDNRGEKQKEEEKNKDKDAEEPTVKVEKEDPTKPQEPTPNTPNPEKVTPDTSTTEDIPEQKQPTVQQESPKVDNPALNDPLVEENKEEKNPNVVPDYSQDQKPPNEAGPTLSKNYPTETFPLMPGFTLESASDNLDGLQRIISVSGGTKANLVGASSFYESRLSDAANFRKKEYSDDASGYNYSVLNGSKNGWNFSVEVAESHHGGAVTLSIYLTR